MSKLLMENWLKNSQQIIKNSDSSEQEVAISPVPVGNKNLYSNNTTSQERISLENISESHSEIEISTDDDQHDETSPDETSLNPLTVKNVKKSLQRGKYAASGWKTDLLFKDWLESGNSENSMMRCKICHCSLMSKMSVLRLHMHSKKHKNAAASLNLNQHIKFESKRINKQVKINEVRSALYISCHTSINSVNHFISVQKMNSGKNGSVQNMALNRTKCTAVIKNIIGPYFIKSIKNDIDDSMYSIIIDESTDISVKKYLGIVLKYYSKSQSDIVTLFVKLEQLDDCKASGIVNAIKKCLREFELPLEKLCGIGTDNASVMVGVNNGVYKKLKDEIPNLILIPCVCHSLQLAVSAAGSSCLPEYIEFLIAETYNWFSNSSSRQGDYSKLFGLINDGHDPKKIVRSCQTRWMSIYSAIKRISDQWLELKTHFSLIGNSEKCYKSSLLNKIYSDNKNLAYILFLKYILKEVTKVNLLFESNSADVTKIFNDLIFLIKFVVYILIPMDTPNFDPMHSPLNKEIWLKFPYLGHETEEI